MEVRDGEAVIIETPEGVELRLELAHVGSRVLAGMLDELIRMALVFATIVLLAGIGYAIEGVTTDTAPSEDDGVSLVAIAIIVLVIFAVAFFYDVLFEVLAAGRTPGKRAVGIRVVRADGDPVTFLPSCIRNLLRIVDQLPMMYGAGIVCALITKRNQRLGDLAASTMVVRDRRAADARRAAAAPVWTPTAAPADAQLMTWDVSALTQDDLATIRHFLVRRESLDPAPRERLAEDMALRLRDRVAGAPPDLDAETFLEGAAAAKTARTG